MRSESHSDSKSKKKSDLQSQNNEIKSQNF